MSSFVENYRLARSMGAGVMRSIEFAKGEVEYGKLMEKTKAVLAEVDRDRAERGLPAVEPSKEMVATMKAELKQASMPMPENGMSMNAKLRAAVRSEARKELVGGSGRGRARIATAAAKVAKTMVAERFDSAAKQVARRIVAERDQEKGRGR